MDFWNWPMLHFSLKTLGFYEEKKETLSSIDIIQRSQTEFREIINKELMHSQYFAWK